MAESVTQVPTKKPSSDEVGVRVITLAGENKGAMMDLTSASSLLHNRKKQVSTAHYIHQHEIKSEGDETEDGSKKKEKSEEKGASSMSEKKAPPLTTFVNSNVQSVNNSILLSSNCSHKDPGVHVALSRKPSGNLVPSTSHHQTKGAHHKDHANGH